MLFAGTVGELGSVAANSFREQIASAGATNTSREQSHSAGAANTSREQHPSVGAGRVRRKVAGDVAGFNC